MHARREGATGAVHAGRAITFRGHDPRGGAPSRGMMLARVRMLALAAGRLTQDKGW